MFIYKFDVLKALSAKGYTSTVIRNNKLLGQSTLTKIRNNESITLQSLNDICIMLNCQPSDVIEITETPEETERFML